MDTRTDTLLNEIESKLKDRFTHYMIVVMDGEEIMHCLDSKVVARGMIEYIANEISQDWQRTT